MKLLTLDSVRVALGNKFVVQVEALRVGTGEFVGLLGPNGAGKSTLLRAILGLIPHEGAIHIEGAELRSLRYAERARVMAYVAQDRDVAWSMTVAEIVTLGRWPHRTPFAGLTGIDVAAVDKAMDRMDVSQLRDRAVTTLSGGERARVLIARALAQETPLLLADEPTAGLDPSHQFALMAMFRELAAEGRTVIATMHEIALASQSCDRIVLMNAGRLVSDGAPKSVLTSDALTRVYGVDAQISEIGNRFSVTPFGLTRTGCFD